MGSDKVRGLGGNEAFSFWFLNWNDNAVMEYSEDVLLTFSCGFNFKHYPFDSHDCIMEYGDKTWTTHVVKFNSSIIIYDTMSHSLGDDPIVIDNSNLPFTFHLHTLAAYEKKGPFKQYTYSTTGMVMKICRNSYGKLLSGYYYLMAAFAVLSMISFVIKPDVVRRRI